MGSSSPLIQAAVKAQESGKANASQAPRLRIQAVKVRGYRKVEGEGPSQAAASATLGWKKTRIPKRGYSSRTSHSGTLVFFSRSLQPR
ncbi:hypothetical protein LEMLEM_LOCUS2292, partial [Lemmus lemmus]